MGLLLELAKAAGGILSLHSPVGRWARKVSEKLDAGGDYIQTWRIASNQTGLSPGIQLNLETTIASNGGVFFNPLNGVYGLKAGKRYHLLAHGQLTNFTNAGAGRLVIQWASNTFIDTGIVYGAPGIFEPRTNANPQNDSPVVEAIIVPGVDIFVMLVVVSSTGQATLPVQSFTATIREF